MISLPIYILGNILLAALPPNIVALFILRILTAFGAASVISAGAGTVADIVEPKKRGYAMSIVLAGPQMGAVMGPLLGGGLLEGGWQWPFGFLGKLSRFFKFLIGH
jgi:MFS family permease